MVASSRVSLKVVGPYDFCLSMRAVRAFRPGPSEGGADLRLAADIGGIAASIEVAANRSGELIAVSRPAVDRLRLKSALEWAVFADLDLKPFYGVAARNARLARIVEGLAGLKPVRPLSLFEMAVIAITEQQISLAAAYRIRQRVIEKFGRPVEDLRVFPDPHALATASQSELLSCGLSHQKAQYIHDLSVQVDGGTLDLDRLKNLTDVEAREMIMSLRGFGSWSADYMLVRGLARPDAVPVDDLGIRSVVGDYLGSGSRLSGEEVSRVLEPFRPFRGLTAFYLLARHMLDLKARSAG